MTSALQPVVVSALPINVPHALTLVNLGDGCRYVLVGAPAEEVAAFEVGGAVGDDPKKARVAGGRKAFEAAGHVLDLETWDNLSDGVMRSALGQRMGCDPVFRRVLAEVARQRVLLQHFERSGAKSYWGGCVSKASGQWHGRNRLGEILCQLAGECARIEDGAAEIPAVAIKIFSREEQLARWRHVAADLTGKLGGDRERPRIVIIRHAESAFNQAEEAFLDTHPELRETPEHWDTDEVYDPHLWDAPLSVKGREQCRQLNETVQHVDSASSASAAASLLRICDLVLCSPYLRTLQTAGLCFEGWPIDGLGRDRDCAEMPGLLLVPELGEHVTSSCDIGRPGLDVLADAEVQPALQTFPSLAPQLKSLGEGWWGATRRDHFPPGFHLSRAHRETNASLRKRCSSALDILAAEIETAPRKKCRIVAVIGHSSHFHEWTGEWLDNCSPTEVELHRSVHHDQYSLRIIGPLALNG
jgi:hypothetical protein